MPVIRSVDEAAEETVVRCMSLGMSYRESCERAGVDAHQWRTRLSRGRTFKRFGPSSRDRKFYLQVLEAQGQFRETVYGSMLQSARAGNAAACTALMARVERLTIQQEAEEIPADELEAARYRRTDLRVRLRESSGIAYVQMLREERALSEEIRRLETEAAKVHDPRSMPPEEWKAYLEGDAASAPDCDLEVYVGEWMRRTGMRMVADSGGAASAHG